VLGGGRYADCEALVERKRRDWIRVGLDRFVIALQSEAAASEAADAEFGVHCTLGDGIMRPRQNSRRVRRQGVAPRYGAEFRLKKSLKEAGARMGHSLLVIVGENEDESGAFYGQGHEKR